MNLTKTCSRCNIQKDIVCFKEIKKTQKYLSHCKDCEKKDRLEKKEKYKQYRKKYNEKRKEEKEKKKYEELKNKYEN
jgi:hypothetical protein